MVLGQAALAEWELLYIHPLKFSGQKQELWPPNTPNPRFQFILMAAIVLKDEKNKIQCVYQC